MFKTLFTLSVLGLVLPLASAAQTPTPQQVQQAQQVIQSGVPITPEMIDAAKSQVPALQGMSDEQIKQEAEQLRNRDPEAVTRELKDKTDAENKPAEDNGTENENAIKDVSNRQSTTASGEFRGEGVRGFPSGLRRYGADFFGNVAAGEGLGPNAPSLPEYVLSTGDELEVSIWGRESRVQTVTVDAEGMFKFSPVEPFRVAGMRFDAAQKLITSEIQKIRGLTASVRLGRLKSIRIMMLGEVVRPGSYSMPAGITVTAALFRSGGISSIGSMREIEVRRNGKVVSRFDVYNVLSKGDMRSDIQLLPGDAIFVPLAKVQVAVTGNVKRPAIYEVKSGFKALEVIELAGGLDFNAYKGRVRLDRVQNNKRNIVLDVDLEKIDARSNVRLENGDVLYVDRVLDRIEDVVYLEGNVHRPGRFQFRPGMTVRDLIPTLSALKPETYFEYGHIKRPAPDDDRPMLFSFSLTDVMTKGARVPLQARDIVTIYSRYDLVERPTVRISGAVRRATTLSYKEGMKVSDLIILSGGLIDAYLPESHLQRTVYDDIKDTSYTELIKINLKHVLEDPNGPENRTIQPFDAVTVFPRQAFESTRPVSLSGAVRRPGTYALAGKMRIWDLIVIGGGLADAHLAEAHLRRSTYSAEGDSFDVQLLRVDLKAILADESSPSNLELRPGDGLQVFARGVGVFQNSVSVFGAVARPGSFELVGQMGVPDLILMAGGLTKTSYKLEVEVVRKTVLKDSVVQRTILRANLKDIMDGKSALALQDGDALYIREIVRTRESMRVELQGEFNFPGTYEFVEGERLSSVIRRAGGFSSQAYIRGAVFLRQRVKEQQLRHATEVARRLEGQLNGMLLQATLPANQASLNMALQRNKALLDEISNAPYLGRVIIKVDKKMKFAGTDWDLPLESGDRIIVGPNVSTVSVLGEVHSPTTVIHTSRSNTVGEVLSQAGGISQYGDYNATMYVDPDGSISTPRTTPWYSSFRGHSVHPGGTVVVPMQPPAKDYLAVWVQGTQILYQIAVSVGVLSTLF